MTAQVPDRVVWQGEELVIVGAAGSGLFHPGAHDLIPTALHTACWRGFIATYEVRDDRLVLASVLARLLDGVRGEHTVDSAPPLFGVRPVWDAERHALRYDGLDQVVPFTGGLLIGADLVRDLYVHMGFQAPWKYERVVELQVESGLIVSARDRGDDVARARTEIAAGTRDPNAPLW